VRFALVAGVAAIVAGVNSGSTASTAAQGRIAFALDRNGTSRLYTVKPSGKGVRQLTRPALRQQLGGDSGPVWSPDGKRVVFERDLPYWGEDRFSLYAVPAPGGRGRALTRGPFDVMPTWSPDGRRLAFVRLIATDPEPVALLYTVDRGGRRAAPLTSGQLDLTPAWSPKGDQIAFARLPGGEAARIDEARLQLANADGSNVQPLGGIAGISPAWSPDGTRLAFVSFADHNGATCGGAECVPNGEIYVVNADGSQPRRLTSSKADDQHPTWSPDARRIAFASGFELKRDGHPPWLVQVPATGGAVTRIGRFWGVRDPAWSPGNVRW
jgi:TolB protein